jgi:hypothetical protein
VTTFYTASRARLRHAQRRAHGPDAGRGREVIERGCVTETGTTARTKAGELVGLLSDSGAAAMSRPSGGSPAGARRRRQVGLPRFRRSAVPAVTLRRWSRLQRA